MPAMEIRTPLSCINGFAEVLLQQHSLLPEARGDVQIILRNGKYLFALVNDLLDLSTIETGRVYIQKSGMSIVREIEESILVMKSALENKNLSIQLRLQTAIPTRRRIGRHSLSANHS